ncbi:MAG: threonine/serine exporter family protein [Lachnospiraceae bacterium]|nr:threonine/serine exporter family protein [Lachnospiraceae bacterium]
MSAEAVAQQNKDVKAVIELATMAGGMLLSSGADTKRAEETMEYIMGQVPGGNTVITVISSSIFISYTPEDEGSPVSSIRKIKSWSTDIEKVHVANDVSRRFCAGEINVREAIDILRKTQDKKDIPLWMLIVGYVMVTACTPLFLGEVQIMNCVATALCGVLMALLVFAFRKVNIGAFFVNAIMSFAAVFIGFGAVLVFPNNIDLTIVAATCICPMFPGVTIVNAVRDILHGDYISGSGRLLEALVRTLGFVMGALAGSIAVTVIIFSTGLLGIIF